MKILFIDNDVNGHHEVYLKNLIIEGFQYAFVLPEYLEDIDKNKQYIFDGNLHSIKGYIRWIRFITDVAKKEEAEIVHFLNADPLIRYFGLFLGIMKNRRIIGTFHHFTYSTLRNIARRIVFSKMETGVVHTEYLYEMAQKNGISNCIQIEYPVFESFDGITRTEARKFWNIPDDNLKTIGAIGGTRELKGLDLLLEALDYVDCDFHLLVAGKEEYFTKEFIESHISRYREKVCLCLRFLNDDELKMALCASDIIALPYRTTFDGASGPLAEGVALKKCIVGPKHGSLGRIIADNHLGYTFESEEIQSLSLGIKEAISSDFTYDEFADRYRNKLDKETFKRKYKRLYLEGM